MEPILLGLLIVTQCAIIAIQLRGIKVNREMARDVQEKIREMDRGGYPLDYR